MVNKYLHLSVKRESLDAIKIVMVVYVIIAFFKTIFLLKVLFVFNNVIYNIKLYFKST